MEIFKDIKGYEGAYQVSNFGRVKSLSRIKTSNARWKEQKVKERIMKLCSVGAYLGLNLKYNKKRKCAKVHRLVVESFIGDIPQGYHVNHIDGDKHNNHVDNLEIVTPKQNVIHAWTNGLCSSQKGICKVNNKTGFSNIQAFRGTSVFSWRVVLIFEDVTFRKCFKNIYNAICYHNALMREYGYSNLIHKITNKDIERYGNGLCCYLK